MIFRRIFHINMVHCITQIMPIAIYLELHGKSFYSKSNFFIFPSYFQYIFLSCDIKEEIPTFSACIKKMCLTPLLPSHFSQNQKKSSCNDSPYKCRALFQIICPYLSIMQSYNKSWKIPI